MTKPVVVIGAGGHARVVIDVLLAGGHEILGVVDPKPGVTAPRGLRVLGAGLDGLDPSACWLALGVGSVSAGDKNRRPELFLDGKRRGFHFPKIVHPFSCISHDSVIDEGVQIMAGAIVQPGVRLGRNVLINTAASVDHDCRIDEHVHIAPGVTLSGSVAIGAGAHLGTGAIVIQGVSIGAGAMICAGALVTRSVDAGARVSR